MTSILHLESKPGTFKKAKLLKKDMTVTEIILWEALRNRRLNGYKFRRQHPILRFIADFYCHEARLIVEIDGEIHDDFTRQDYDQGRSYELTITGLKSSGSQIRILKIIYMKYFNVSK